MKKILAVLDLLLFSSTVFPQFNEPKLQKATQVIVDGQHEYILSVTNTEGEEYFYGKGNKWGTRTSAKKDQADALTVRFHANPTTIDGIEYTNTVKFNNYVIGRGGWGAFVDCDSGLQAWVDGQGRTGDDRWIITDKGDGRIQLANLNAPGGLFSFTPYRSQWSEDDQDYLLVESEDGYGFDNSLWFVGARVDSIDILQLDKYGYPVTDEKGNNIVIGKRATISYGNEIYDTWQAYDVSTYNARKKIFSWYWGADENGMRGADYAERYTAVKEAVDNAITDYDNPNATLEEIEGAYNELKIAILHSVGEVWWEASVIPSDVFGNGTPANMIIYAPEGTETELDYNVVIGGVCQNLVLTEGEPLSISQEFEAEYAILTRTFSRPTNIGQGGGWESIVIPFDVTSIIDELGRPLAPFGSDKPGTHPFWLAQMTPGGNFAYCTEMKANTPYLISMPNSPLYIDDFNITGEVQFIGENVTVKKTDDAQPVNGSGIQIVPTYIETTNDAELYALNREPIVDEEENELPAGSVFVSDNTSVALPFEFYVLFQSAPVKGQYMPIEFDNAVDQLQRLYADTYGSLHIHSEEGHLVIQATKPQTIGIYNAQGMLVCTLHLQPGENRTPQLTPGLYVVGKEKYMVK